MSRQFVSTVRYFCWFSLAAALATAARAQLVSDGATNTLSNVTNTFTGDVTVGTNGAFTLLVLSDNALLTNSLNGVIGRNLTAKSNEVRLISSTARWRMGGILFVGSNGVANRLVVSNGAAVENSSGSLGFRLESSNNFALVTGNGSLWSNRNNLDIGGLGKDNQMIVSNGGWVVSKTARLGVDASGSNNFVLVTGAGSVWSNALNLSVGNIAPGNRLVIEAGGLVSCDTGLVGDFNSASNNEALVTGPGSLWINRSSLTIGGQMPRNRLVVSNGAAVWSGNATIGASFGNNSSGLLTGADTLWSNQNALVVGSSTFGNQLVVSNGATLATSNLFVGFQSFSTNNRVVVDGGTLRVTNVAGNGTLDVRRGTNVLNAGLIEVDQLLVTNAAGIFEFNGGTLAVHDSTVNSGVGLGLRVGDGTNAATLFFSGNGTNTVGGVCTISSNAVLAGNGRLVGTMTAQAGSTISPGASIGKISLSVTPTLQGNIFMEISKNGAVLTNDQIQIFGPASSFNYGGSLVVSNVGLTALTNGDTFKLFEASSYLGSFASITVPPVSNGLGWEENFDVDGKLYVTNGFVWAVTLPATSVGATSAVLQGQGNPRGRDSSGFFLLAGGNKTPLQQLGNGISKTNFSELITGLSPGTDYFFAAVGSNSLGQFGFSGRFFRTLGPSVQTLPPTIGNGTVTLNGLANPHGTNTSAWFEWGTTTNYGAVTPTHPLGHGTTDTNFSEVLTSVAFDVEYHVRAVASNSFGTVFGEDRSFLPGLITYLKASNAGTSDQFGFSVAMSGDTMVVGAVSEASNATGVNGGQTNNGAFSAGAAYVFVRNGFTWTQQAYLKASNTGAGDLFGSAVAISGDTIVVAARAEDSSATGINGDGSNDSAPDSGAVYVFVRSGSNWTQQAYLKASNTDSNDLFGNSVSISGDTIVIGARFESSNATGINGNQSDNSFTNSGAAYVFVRNGSNWTQQAYLKASNTEAGDEFGRVVAISGDTILAGAAGESSSATGVNGNQSNNSATNSGAAYVFVRNGTNWTQQAYLKAGNTEAGDQFGIRVAASGDTVVIGAIGEDSNAKGVNGNGDNNFATDSGAAFVFVRNGTNWTQQAYLKASNTESTDSFAFSVAISGDTLVVGAIAEDGNAIGVNGDQSNNSATDSGAAYVFVRNGTTWSQRAYLKPSNTDPVDRFGVSAALSGGIVVVGADLEDSAATGVNGDGSNNTAGGAGAVYVFDLSSLIPPELTIVPSGVNEVTLSWFPPTPGFALQESLTLSPVSWSNSPSGETNPITLPITDQTKFFRLFKP